MNRVTGGHPGLRAGNRLGNSGPIGEPYLPNVRERYIPPITGTVQGGLSQALGGASDALSAMGSGVNILAQLEQARAAQRAALYKALGVGSKGLGKLLGKLYGRPGSGDPSLELYGDFGGAGSGLLGLLGNPSAWGRPEMGTALGDPRF